MNRWKEIIVKLNKSLIAQAQDEAEREGKPRLLRDDEVKGLFVRVVSNDKNPVSSLRYRVGRGRGAPIKEVKLGELTKEFPIDAARRQALKIKTAAHDGRDIIQEAKDKADQEKKAAVENAERRFEVVAERWLDAIDEKRWKDGPRIVRSDLKTAWMGRQIDAITKQDVIDLVRAVSERAKNSGRANATGAQGARVLSTANRLFNWCIGENILKEGQNPCFLVKAPVRHKRGERVLTEPEIRAFWTATGQLGYPFGVCFRLLLLTLQRKETVAKSERGEQDFKDGIWNIPPDHLKGGEKRHALPLTPDIEAQFRIAMEASEHPTRLFSSDGETKISGWSKIKTKLDELMEIELSREADALGKDPASYTLKPWVFHDLRRTGASAMVNEPCNIDSDTIDYVQHHLPAKMTEIQLTYQLVKNRKRMHNALLAWNARLREILSEGPDLDQKK